MAGESRSVVVRLSLDTAEAIRGSQQFGAEMDKAMSQAEKSAMRADQAVDKVGATAGKMAVGLTAVLTASGKAAVDWESQFAGVEKTVDGTAKQMAVLEDELRELARTMPATHEEIAATAEAAGQLGVAREDVTDFTKVMIQLGETTNLTADEAATSIAQIANVMGTSGDEVDNFGAALVALGNDGASTEAQILGMAQRIAGAGAQIGLAESDILAIANAAASMGIEVEAGGSAISRVFTEMAKATKQGGEGLDQFAEIAGVSSQEFTRAFEEDPARAFAAFTAGLDRINASGGDVFTTLDQLGLSDVRVSQALLSMAASGDLLTDSLDLGAQAYKENSALAEEFAKRAGTTGAEVQVAMNNIRDAAIDAGNVLLPVVAEVAEGVTTVSQAFGDLPGPVQAAIVKLLAVAAIIGGATWFGVKTVRGITATRDAIAALGGASGTTASSLGRLGRTAGGLAAVAGAVTVLGNALADATGASIDTENLSRDLEALANGTNSEILSRIVGDLDMLSSTANNAAEPIREVVTGLGLFGNTGLDNAAENLENVDQALAAMVEGGQGDRAAAIIESIAAGLNGLPAGASVSQEALDGTIEKFGAYGTALENAAAAEAAAAGSADEVAGAVGGVGDEAASSADQVAELVSALDALLSPKLDLAEATDQWRDGLRNLNEGLAKNVRSLKGNTDAASLNRSAIRDQVRNLLGVVNAQAEAGAGTQRLTATMKDGRRAILEAGEAAGISKKDMQDYLKVLGLTPKQIKTTVQALTDKANQDVNKTRGNMRDLDGEKANPKVDVDTAAARGAIAGIITSLRNIPDENVNVWVTRRGATSGTGMGARIESAHGNILHFANGDIANGHQPELYRGGVTRVWGEEETKGEAYIPLANDSRRPRAKAILAETAGLLGGVAYFADGGMRGGRQLSLDDRGDMLRLQATVRDLVRDLSRTGKDQIKGLDRLISKNDLAMAKRDLQLARITPRLEARSEEVTKRLELIEIEKQLAQEQRDTQAQMLDQLRDQAQAFADTVGGRFQTGIFGDLDVAGAVANGGMSSAWVQQMQAWAQQQEDFDGIRDGGAEWVDRYLATLSQAEREAAMAEARATTLQQDTYDADRFARALQQLAELGLDGAAFDELAMSGNLNAAQYYAGMTAEQIDTFEQLYNARDAAAANAGAVAAEAQFGALITEQQVATQAAREHYRAVERRAERAERRLEAIEAQLAGAPPKIGRHVGDAIKNEIRHGQRSAG